MFRVGELARVKATPLLANAQFHGHVGRILKMSPISLPPEQVADIIRAQPVYRSWLPKLNAEHGIYAAIKFTSPILGQYIWDMPLSALEAIR